MKVMICQPMNGRTDEEILSERNKLVYEFNKLGIEVVDSVISDEEKDKYLPTDCNLPVAYLGYGTMKYLSVVDAAFFVHGWENARGCKIEYAICEAYGVPILTEDDNYIYTAKQARGMK